MTDSQVPILSIGGPGSSLEVTIRRQPLVWSGAEPWFDVEIRIEAFPFSGTVSSVLLELDLHNWVESLRRLGSDLPRTAVLGGDRAAELTLIAETQSGGQPGRIVVEVIVTPSGDDPYPLLRFLVFEVEPFWADVIQRLHGILG